MFFQTINTLFYDFLYYLFVEAFNIHAFIE